MTIKGPMEKKNVLLKSVIQLFFRIAITFFFFMAAQECPCKFLVCANISWYKNVTTFKLQTMVAPLVCAHSYI